MSLVLGTGSSAITLPTPKSAVYSINKLWSKNTGRLDSGYFVGELVSTKKKIEFEFPPLSPSQLSIVQNATSVQFSHCTCNDMASSGNWSFDCYFGDISIEAYSWKNGIKYAIGVRFSAIER